MTTQRIAWLRRSFSFTIVLAVLCGGTVSCSASNNPPAASTQQAPRPLNSDEAYQLATVLFKNYSAGTREVTGTLVDGAKEAQIKGWLDFTAGTGYARVAPRSSTDPNFPQDTFLARWDKNTVELLSETVASTELPPLPEPAGQWERLPLDSGASFVSTGFAALLGLAKDRPENPQLLQQSTAQWIKSEKIGDQSANVFTGPSGNDMKPSSASEAASTSASPSMATDGSGVRYWLDSEGTLLRFEIRLSPSGSFSRFDFSDAAEGVVFDGPKTAG